MKELTAKEAYEKLAVLCSKAEKCEYDTVQLLYRWKIPVSEHTEVVERLKRERYIDNERYVRYYVRDKVRYNGWGERKIADMLAMKQIDRSFVYQIISEEIKTDQLKENMISVLRKKATSVKAKDDYDLRNKLVRFGLSRGYRYDRLSEALKEIIGGDIEFD